MFIIEIIFLDDCGQSSGNYGFGFNILNHLNVNYTISHQVSVTALCEFELK